MYCPNCGNETVSGARYCRTCGTDVALVQQALSGTVAAAPVQRPRGPEPAALLEKSIRSSFIGFAFLVVAVCSFVFAPGGQYWWFWMLVPGFIMAGMGLSEYVRYRAVRAALGPPGGAERVSELPAAPFAEQLPPPSITEVTTRHLDQRERERS